VSDSNGTPTNEERLPQRYPLRAVRDYPDVAGIGSQENQTPALNRYDLFCGVLYVLKSGCQWRMLPTDYPNWNSIYAHFRKWSTKPDDGPSLLEEA
jgi:transposase